MGMPKEGSLLEIDIRALADLVDDLMWCHIKTDKMEQFPSVLERLRGNINDPEWQRKIVYFHAMHALWPDWDRNAGRRELRKLGSVADDKDIDVLQLYLDLFGGNLTFSEQEDLVDRILALSKTFNDRFHYKGSRTVLYLTIGDKRKAVAELSEAIEEARAQQDEEGLSGYQRYRLALCLDLLGALRGNKGLLTEAINLYQDLLKTEDLSIKGRAEVLGLLADTHRHNGDWESARDSYLNALKTLPSSIHKVFLCECLRELEKIDEATKVLEEVTLESLSDSEQADYAFTLAALAIETGEPERLQNAKAILKKVNIPEPYFRERRDALLLNVQEALSSGSSQTLVRRTKSLLSNITRSATSYLILKPSFMGIGIDVGKIFEDMSKRGKNVASAPVNSPADKGK
jgi:tetratricopeptide (TPR) repeat protein